MDPSIPFFILSFNNSSVISIVALVVLLVFSALISGSEVAFFSLNQVQLDTESKTFKNQKLVAKLLSNPKRLLATILVANNFINIATVLLFAHAFDPYFDKIDVVVDLYFFKLSLSFFFKIVLVTFLILLFGEILPKVYASRNNEKFSGFMAKPLLFLKKILVMFSAPMQAGTTFLENKLTKTKSEISINQLSQVLELTADETTDGEQKILDGIVSFGNTDTKQVMRSRVDIFALNSATSFSEVLQLIIKAGYSRIPVYEETLDKIVGMLYVKDLLPYLEKKDVKWQELIREPFFVPENKKLDDLLKEFQEKKVHLAIVVDEYGGTSGVVTLEDIVEEIIGDINDEFDDESLVYSKLDDHNYVFEGKTSLKDIYRVVDIDEELFEENKGEAETIAGFVLEISGGFPKKDEKITFQGYVFTVESLGSKRIKQLKLTLPE
ncbi:MAG: gliding motility-associated protein GldE [Flavobacteriaceae bacterium]|nr:gliding motility-associated protein GldE [Flavobacteriaceae bacterium]